MRNDLHIKALERASAVKGGIGSLATFLGVSESTVALWMQGKATLPAPMFEKVLDILLDGDMAALIGSSRAQMKAPARVLVVDDDPSGAYGLAHALRELGHPVDIAHDGPSAIESARQLRPEVIFLDLRMPGMDGVEIARVLKAEGLGQHIIAATAYPSELQQQRTAAVGFDAHVVKPVEPGSLEKLLTSLH
jgi:CheY-like chemotaxis protein